MNELQVALDELLAMALATASGRIYREVQTTPGPYDDAQAELEHDMLNDAVDEYVRLRDA